MPGTYSIRINNNSGEAQDYHLFSSKPQIDGPVASKVKSRAFQSAEQVPNAGVVEFEVSKRFYAVTGKWIGEPGIKTSVTQMKPVVFGSKKADGTLTPGTTLNIKVLDHKTPTFSEVAAESTGYANSFAVVTSDDFTQDDAKHNNFFLGIAVSTDGTSCTPISTFRPEPSVQYQIQPTTIFYVAAGSFTHTDIMDSSELSEALAIDFSARCTNEVVISHGDDGKLVILQE